MSIVNLVSDRRRTVAAANARFWGDVRDAVRAVPHDYTSGSLGRAVLLLAVPMVLEMGMQSVFAVVDLYFVGRLGSEAVAILGLSAALISLVFAVSMGLSMGTAAMVARRVGEGSPEEAAAAAVQAIAAGCVASFVIGVAGVVWASDLLMLLGATPELAASGRRFTAIMLGGCVTVTLLFMINGIFRGAGDPVLAMRALWLANLVNIVLDPILIFGLGPVPALGLEGAAIATTVGRGLGVAYQLRALTSGNGRVVIDWRRACLQPQTLLRLLRIGGIGSVQYLVGTASFVGLIRILAPFGDTALAGYTVAVRIIIFVLLPVWGVGNAAATLVGQNLGAGQPDRAGRAVWFTARLNTVLLGVIGVIFVIFAESIVGLLATDPDVVALAVTCLRIVACSYVFWGFGLVTVLAFNGAGDTTTPTWINFLVYWVVQLPLAWALAGPAGLGPSGVFVTVAVCQTLMAAVGVVAFRRGSWKKRVL
ncbi:MAG: MATE family efflux transporter [Acidobacteria bacterium]|nr:MATE family efflux transporter [Acidobacteriota bacterium]